VKGTGGQEGGGGGVNGMEASWGGGLCWHWKPAPHTCIGYPKSAYSTRSPDALPVSVVKPTLAHSTESYYGAQGASL
jgi:hypothetical protein